MTIRSIPIVLLSLAVVAAPDARARKRTELHPYLAVDVTALSDLKNGGGVQAYASVSGGIDASTSGPRAEAQISARAEQRFGLTDNTGDSFVLSGLTRARFDAVPNLLSIEGGAIGTRVRTGLVGANPLPGLGRPSNTSQLYSAYVGPTLATRAGPFDVGAFYRFGYSKVESSNRNVFLGAPRVDSFDTSTDHSAGASVGMKSGVLPFGWTVSGGYTRDDASQLDQRFEGKYVRADVVVPITPTVAATGGVGYEDIKSSQRDPLRDAQGNALVDVNGRFATDPASPRRLAYDSTGFIWDVGVLWRPSRRTSASARVGRRYGSMTYTGDFSWQPTENQAVSIGVYDGVTTFGSQINEGLSRVPTRFVVQRDSFDSQFAGGCVFGGSGAGAGTCLSPALQSIASGTYRSRGASALWRYTHGSISGGVALNYNQRRFYAPRVGTFSIDGVTDRSVTAQAFLAKRLDEVSGIEGTLYGNWYDSGIAGVPRVTGVGGTAAYYRNFGPRLSGNAALGLYSTDGDGLDSTLTGAAQVGMRYTF